MKMAVRLLKYPSVARRATKQSGPEVTVTQKLCGLSHSESVRKRSPM